MNFKVTCCASAWLEIKLKDFTQSTPWWLELAIERYTKAASTTAVLQTTQCKAHGHVVTDGPWPLMAKLLKLQNARNDFATFDKMEVHQATHRAPSEFKS